MHCTLPEPGRDNGSLTGGGVRPPGGSLFAGSGFKPLFTDGAGMTAPGRTDWSQRAAGAGQVRIWFGSPNHGLVPAGTYGLGSRHSRGVAARFGVTPGIVEEARPGAFAGVDAGRLAVAAGLAVDEVQS